jgi:hypothetical protein
VPWLYLIFIYCHSLLIALCPAIEMSMRLEPSDILTIGGISVKLGLIAHIKYINSESELVFTISRRSTERVTTATEIPEPLLICSTPIATDHGEWHPESCIKSGCHLPKSISRLSSYLYPTTA